MKKLMIAAAIVCAAAFAQAATYNWSTSSDGVYAPEGSALDNGGGALIAGLPVYIFDANVVDRSELITALSNGNLTILDSALENVSGTTFAVGSSDGAFMASGYGDWNNTDPTKVGLSAVEGKGSAFAVIFDKASAANATQFFVTDALTDIDCTGNVASMGDYASIPFGEIDASGDWNTITTAAPEPTSGLLLLLGIAGLALKRKRA